MTDICPWSDCGRPLEGLGRFCHACGRYTDDAGGVRPGSANLSPGQAHPASTTGQLPDPRSEKEVQLGIRQTLELYGYHVSDFSQDRPTRQTPGIPDLYAMGHGRSIWIEVKREDGRVSKHQAGWHRIARENGVEVVVWRHEADAISWHKRATEPTSIHAESAGAAAGHRRGLGDPVLGMGEREASAREAQP